MKVAENLCICLNTELWLVLLKTFEKLESTKANSSGRTRRTRRYVSGLYKSNVVMLIGGVSYGEVWTLCYIEY
jgi:hypothetical protein